MCLYQEATLLNHSQNLLQLPLLLLAQKRRELDIIHDNKVTPLIRFLAERHTQVRIRVTASRLRGTGFVEIDLLSIDSGDCSLPTRKGFLKLEVDFVVQVVAFTCEERMLFL
jgi:hypothetical protein